MFDGVSDVADTANDEAAGWFSFSRKEFWLLSDFGQDREQSLIDQEVWNVGKNFLKTGQNIVKSCVSVANAENDVLHSHNCLNVELETAPARSTWWRSLDVVDCKRKETF